MSTLYKVTFLCTGGNLRALRQLILNVVDHSNTVVVVLWSDHETNLKLKIKIHMRLITILIQLWNTFIHILYDSTLSINYYQYGAQCVVAETEIWDVSLDLNKF